MKQGLSRFTFYLHQIGEMMEKAGNEKDPAMWLFNNNGRTPFFMLEALSRIYAGLHDRKLFDKLRNRFKLIEDELGQIDYYNSLSVALNENKKVPAGCLNYFKLKTEESALSMNKILKEEGWVDDYDRRITKITRKLKKADWLKP